MDDLVRYASADGIATLTMDDGKANALSLDMSTALSRGLDQAEAEARVVVLTGRPGVLCGGFDLRVIRGDDENARTRMRAAGFDLLKRLYLYPLPIVVACTGHALAAGALILLTGDMRLGVSGAFKIGLNEVAIGLPLPSIGVELARDRLSPRALTSAVAGAQVFDPIGAFDAGYLDAVATAETFDGTVQERARACLDLDRTAFAVTKQRLRQATIDRITN